MNKLNKLKKYVNKRNIILAGFSLLMIIGLICSTTLSKYTSIEQMNAEANLEKFYALARIYYIKDGETEKTEAEINDDGYIELNPSEFETLTVALEYTGKARTYCRVKLDCSWIRNDTEITADGSVNKYTEIVPHDYPEYTCGDKIYNNIEKDGYFYFTDILEAEDDVIETYDVITKVETGDDVGDLIDPDKDKSEKVRVILTVDCVQYNRVSELWKINTLPWWQ